MLMSATWRYGFVAKTWRNLQARKRADVGCVETLATWTHSFSGL